MEKKKTKSASKSAGKTATKSAGKTTGKASGKTTGKNDSGKKADPETESMLLGLLKDEIKDIYWAEKHLLKALPKMQKAATNDVLKKAFADHLEQTRVHVSRLEEVFSLLGEKAQAKKCEAMAGLTKEGEEIIEDTEKGTSTRDVGLILAAQKVEHYEIATYGGLAQLAKTLGLNEVKDLLGTTLDEEKATDEGLTEIAESSINHMSLEEEEEA